jgi:hypothetical protein
MRRTRRFPRRILIVVAPLLSGAFGSTLNVLQGQDSARIDASRSWRVAHDPFVDLWFHSLAVVGFDGYGPLPMYDAQYVARVRAAKLGAHLTTTLDRRSAEFHTAFAADSAFEALHFLPLYFAGTDPAVALAALASALHGAPHAGLHEPLALTAQLAADAFPTDRERAVLAGFIDAMSDEWKSFARADRASHAAEDRQTLQQLQSAWTDGFAPLLAGYLTSIDAQRGTILVSPAIGSEGRIIQNVGGTVMIAVSARGSVGKNAPLLYAIRELAYPLLDQLRSPIAVQTSRVVASRSRDAAAVRAGALVLDAIGNPLAAAEYRRLFVDAIGGRTLEQAYPLSSTAESELRQLVIRAAHGAVSRRSSYENR